MVRRQTAGRNLAARSGFRAKWLTRRGASGFPQLLWITLWMDCHYSAADVAARWFTGFDHSLIDIFNLMKNMKNLPMIFFPASGFAYGSRQLRPLEAL
ncbi:hypothetical protein [Thioalkalivibrio sp.]|uniref:hypothetical protein n=1 Tax=Thioalkalivibrio sp. TaxID=2093813 RepID=UPI0025E0AA66|nr:hypothetical protein [Thioalkalivibrio sp.]